MHELADQFLSHLRASWHYRWFAVGLAWILAVSGWFHVYRMPDRFEASARVWVDTQSVIKQFMSGITTQPNVSHMVGSISRTLISRPNMEKVIRLADLEIGLNTPQERDQLITRLTRELTVQSPGGDLYLTAFSDTDSERAKRVVQSLLTIFEEGSRSGQEKDSEAARRFLDEEIKNSKEKLDAAEKVVIDFKRRQTLMSGGRDYTRVIEAQAALNEATLELKIAEAGRDAIKKNLTDETEIPSLLGDKSVDGGGSPESNARILALEEKLNGLRFNYTEQHPDIVAIVRTIAQLKEQQKAEAQLRRPAPSEQQRAEAQSRNLSRSVAQQAPANLSLVTAEASVAAVKIRVDELRKRYEELKAAANAAPQMDLEYTHIARDYDMVRNQHATLLARRETARISNEMETRTSVTEFRVVDPPRVVRKGPNRPILNSIVLLVALGGGIGLAFVLSQIRPTFNDERRLRELSGIQVLGTIVMEWTDRQRARRTRGLVALLISFASLLSAYAAIMVALALAAARA